MPARIISQAKSPRHNSSHFDLRPSFIPDQVQSYNNCLTGSFVFDPSPTSGQVCDLLSPFYFSKQLRSG